MKKFIISITLLFIAGSAFAATPPNAAIIQVHDMQMINQQRFRMNEINDYNDVQQEKARYAERNAPQSADKTLIQKIFNKKSKIIEQDGEIKIKYEE